MRGTHEEASEVDVIRGRGQRYNRSSVASPWEVYEKLSVVSPWENGMSLQVL